MNESFFKKDVEIKGIELVTETKIEDKEVDELFDIEKELNSQE